MIPICFALSRPEPTRPDRMNPRGSRREGRRWSPTGVRPHGEDPGRLGPRHRPGRPEGAEARPGRDARPGRGRGVRLRRVPQDPQPARRRPRAARPRGAGDLPRTQRPEGLQGRHRACPARRAWSSSSSCRRSRRSGSPTSSSSRPGSRSPSPSRRSSGPTSRSAATRRASDEDFTMAEVGLFAMKRDQINRAILPFTRRRDRGRHRPDGPDRPLQLHHLRPAQGDRTSKGSVVLLDIGADNTDLIITDGTRIWQRNVPIGGNHFTRALTKELKLTFAKAEHLKRNATKAPDPAVDLHRDARASSTTSPARSTARSGSIRASTGPPRSPR